MCSRSLSSPSRSRNTPRPTPRTDSKWHWRIDSMSIPPRTGSILCYIGCPGSMCSVDSMFSSCPRLGLPHMLGPGKRRRSGERILVPLMREFNGKAWKQGCKAVRRPRLKEQERSSMNRRGGRGSLGGFWAKSCWGPERPARAFHSERCGNI